jgi:hypothetical protein
VKYRKDAERRGRSIIDDDEPLVDISSKRTSHIIHSAAVSYQKVSRQCQLIVDS